MPRSSLRSVTPVRLRVPLVCHPPTTSGDCLQPRDFTYIDNVVQANLLACEAPKAACGRGINVACGERVSLLEILEVLYGLARSAGAPPCPGGSASLCWIS